MKQFLKDLGITRKTVTRAFRTFLQSFTGTLMTDLALVVTDSGIDTKYLLLTVLVPAISAAMATLMNLDKEGGNNENG